MKSIDNKNYNSITEFFHIKKEIDSILIQKEFLENYKVKYRDMFNLTTESFSPYRMELSQFKYINYFKTKNPEINIDFLKKILDMEMNRDILEYISPEQITATILAYEKLSQKQSFILADETGQGKGRILAAIVKIFINQNISVLFLTENSQLFSDFYRDLTIFDFEPIPIILHKTTKIYKNNKIIYKSLNKKDFDELLTTKNHKKLNNESSSDNNFLNKNTGKLDTNNLNDDVYHHDNNAKFILSTYSQLAKDSKNLKINYLKNNFNGIIILDEAHNASGFSVINDKIKILSKQALGFLYSSATFAKQEFNLDFYLKNLDVSRFTKIHLLSGLSNDNGKIREALTNSLALSGNLVRREHSPLPKPEEIVVELGDYNSNLIENFSNFWNVIFEILKILKENFDIKEKLLNQRIFQNLQRTQREVSILFKIDSLVEFIKNKVNNNEKVVVAIESTFQSFLMEVLLQKNSDNLSADDETREDVENNLLKEKFVGDVTYRTKLEAMINFITPDEIMDKIQHKKENIDILRKKAFDLIENFSKFTISPLDYLKTRLLEININSLELSGRTMGFDSEKKTIKPVNIERYDVVNKFNDSDDYNVIFLTLAGSTGISLHSSNKFNSKKKRNLIEMDIAQNPAKRIQFWGRVRRKDQIFEPSYYTLSLDTMYEKKKLDKENTKTNSVLSHNGAIIDDYSGLISEAGEFLINKWAKNNPYQAMKLGIFLNKNAYNIVPDNETKQNDFTNIETALSRSILLNKPQRNYLDTYLKNTIKYRADYELIRKSELVYKNSKIIRTKLLWGDGIDFFSITNTISSSSVYLNERVFENNESINVELLNKILKKYISIDNRAIIAKEYTQHPLFTENDEFLYFKKILKDIIPGNIILITHPQTEEVVPAIILALENNFNKEIKPDLNQIAIKLLINKFEKESVFSLDIIKNDKNIFFTNDNYEKYLEIFVNLSSKKTLCTLEGNIIVASSISKRNNFGFMGLIEDERKGILNCIILEKNFNFEFFKNYKKEFIDIEQIISYFNNFNKSPIFSDIGFYCYNTSNGFILHFNRKKYEKIKEDYLTFNINKKLSEERVNPENSSEIIRILQWKDFRYVFYCFQNLNIYFSFEPNEKTNKWYQDDCYARFRDKNFKQ